MKIKTFTLLLVLITTSSFSQNVYVSTINNQIYRINEDNTLELIVDVLGLSSFMDIAFTPDGTLYGITSSKIVKIDTEDASVEFLVTLPSENGGTYTSLVAANDNELFFINGHTKELYKFDINTAELSPVAFLDQSTPGDLTFYMGNIIFPTFQEIKLYSINDDSLTDILDLSSLTGINPIWGIANDFTDCETNRIIASTANGEIWELDLANNQMTQLPINTFDLTILGMTSINESAASDCGGNSTSTHSTNFPNRLNVFPNPTSDFLTYNTDSTIDQIEIYTVAGQLVKTIANPSTNQILLQDFDKGLYVLKFYAGSTTKNVKVVKM